MRRCDGGVSDSAARSRIHRLSHVTARRALLAEQQQALVAVAWSHHAEGVAAACGEQLHLHIAARSATSS